MKSPEYDIVQGAHDTLPCCGTTKGCMGGGRSSWSTLAYYGYGEAFLVGCSGTRAEWGMEVLYDIPGSRTVWWSEKSVRLVALGIPLVAPLWD
jgi:hypothetical protein